jgi:tRNA A37 methylthiotransferase MiaB
MSVRYCIIPQTRVAKVATAQEKCGASSRMPYFRISRRDRRRTSDRTGATLATMRLATLVRMLAEWDAEVLFRISSLEPMDCTSEIVELVATSPRLAPHFHLPLQHGADDMLRAMRRPYTASAYANLVGQVRARLPHASIGSDIIVGFPGESSAHFEEAEAFLRELPLTHLHGPDHTGTEYFNVRKVEVLIQRERRVRHGHDTTGFGNAENRASR